MLRLISLEEYDSYILCGFSAGCNEILNTLLSGNNNCKGILLQSPWIPIIEKQAKNILDILEENNIWLQIICGKNDADCAPLIETFMTLANERKLNCHCHWVDNIGHSYPDDFSAITKKLLRKIDIWYEELLINFIRLNLLLSIKTLID